MAGHRISYSVTEPDNTVTDAPIPPDLAHLSARGWAGELTFRLGSTKWRCLSGIGHSHEIRPKLCSFSSRCSYSSSSRRHRRGRRLRSGLLRWCADGELPICPNPAFSKESRMRGRRFFPDLASFDDARSEMFSWSSQLWRCAGGAATDPDVLTGLFVGACAGKKVPRILDDRFASHNKILLSCWQDWRLLLPPNWSFAFFLSISICLVIDCLVVTWDESAWAFGSTNSIRSF